MIWCRLDIDAGDTAVVRLRLSPSGDPIDEAWHDTMAVRVWEADEFYADLAPSLTTAEDALILRQAFAGMLWGKQFFHFDVQQWLDGDPFGPTPPASRKYGRNAEWAHLNNADVISMPDP